MARRGETLREHILWTAKSVFLELGFERASMDVIAARAETSKRTLYAHFASKEGLFLAVVELVRGLFLSKLKRPDEYAADPAEALTEFCGRYLEFLLYEANVQWCRVSLAEAVRFPEGAQQYYDVLFTEVGLRLSSYLESALHVSPTRSREEGDRLLAEVVFPRFTRTLFGVEAWGKQFSGGAGPAALDFAPVRKIVERFLKQMTAMPRGD